MSDASDKKHKKGHEEEAHENHERGLVTYADMLTLLMVLFIVLFAMSAVDSKKFQALAQGLSAGFGGHVSPLSGGSGVMDQQGTDPKPVDLMTTVVPPTEVSPEVSAAMKSA